MKTSYKFWYIRRDDDGTVVEIVAKFFEGEINTKKETDLDGNLHDVTKYRRTKLLTGKDLDHATGKIVKDFSQEDCVLYTQKDFGKIKSEDECIAFMNKELSKDEIREPVDIQKETDIGKIKLLNFK